MESPGDILLEKLKQRYTICHGKYRSAKSDYYTFRNIFIIVYPFAIAALIVMLFFKRFDKLNLLEAAGVLLFHLLILIPLAYYPRKYLAEMRNIKFHLDLAEIYVVCRGNTSYHPPDLDFSGSRLGKNCTYLERGRIKASVYDKLFDIR